MNIQTEKNKMLEQVSNEPIRLSSGLLQRGLIDLANRQVSLEEIRQARSEHQMFQGLTDVAIEIALKQPALWEYRLFFQVLSDEVLKYKNLRYNVSSIVISETGVFVDRFNVSQWVTKYITKVESILDYNNVLIKQEFPKAIGLPGQPSDTSELISVAIQIGLVYRLFCEWSARLSQINCDPSFDVLFNTLPKLVDKILYEMENYGPESLAQIDKALKDEAANPGKPIHVNLTLTFEIDDEDMREMRGEAKRLSII